MFFKRRIIDSFKSDTIITPTLQRRTTEAQGFHDLLKDITAQLISGTDGTLPGFTMLFCLLSVVPSWKRSTIN